jgi:hypothetical protein
MTIASRIGGIALIAALATVGEAAGALVGFIIGGKTRILLFAFALLLTGTAAPSAL